MSKGKTLSYSLIDAFGIERWAKQDQAIMLLLVEELLEDKIKLRGRGKLRIHLKVSHEL